MWTAWLSYTWSMVQRVHMVGSRVLIISSSNAHYQTPTHQRDLFHTVMFDDW